MAAPQLSLKDSMRRSARAVRAACDPRLGARLAVTPPAGAVIAGYWPMGDEIDVRPLLLRLHSDHAIVLPVTPVRGAALRFRRWHPGMAMVPERFGTLAPTGEEMTPDWLLVPLLAFDRRGGRLGYGGGFYDRTLAGLPGAVAIGCAFAAQEVAAVPMEAHDIRLHGVVTELGLTSPLPLWEGPGEG